MKKLEEYELLVNDVFYRCWHILEYINKKSPLTELDEEAIKATIMDALVEKGLINPNRDSLDFENLCIKENYPEGYHFEKHPFVRGYPLWMKEALRKKILLISGSTPVSVSTSMYAPGITRCIYDMNTGISSIFDEFTFYVVNYDSPTRPGKRAKERPFLEVEIDGILHLVDTTTRRIYRSDEFKRRYGFEVLDKAQKSKFNERQMEIYKEQTTPVTNLYTFAMYLNMVDCLHVDVSWAPYEAEFFYEIEKSKELYPRVVELKKQIDEEMKHDIGDMESLKRLTLLSKEERERSQKENN